MNTSFKKGVLSLVVTALVTQSVGALTPRAYYFNNFVNLEDSAGSTNGSSSKVTASVKSTTETGWKATAKNWFGKAYNGLQTVLGFAWANKGTGTAAMTSAYLGKQAYQNFDKKKGVTGNKKAIAQGTTSAVISAATVGNIASQVTGKGSFDFSAAPVRDTVTKFVGKLPAPKSIKNIKLSSVLNNTTHLQKAGIAAGLVLGSVALYKGGKFAYDKYQTTESKNEVRLKNALENREGVFSVSVFGKNLGAKVSEKIKDGSYKYQGGNIVNKEGNIVVDGTEYYHTSPGFVTRAKKKVSSMFKRGNGEEATQKLEQQKKQEEAARKKLQQEEAARKKLQQEEAARKKLQQEEAARRAAQAPKVAKLALSNVFVESNGVITVDSAKFAEAKKLDSTLSGNAKTKFNSAVTAIEKIANKGTRGVTTAHEFNVKARTAIENIA